MQLLVRAELVLSGWWCVCVGVCTCACVCLYLMCGDTDQTNGNSLSNGGLNNSRTLWTPGAKFTFNLMRLLTSVMYSGCQGYSIIIHRRMCIQTFMKCKEIQPHAYCKWSF